MKSLIKMVFSWFTRKQAQESVYTINGVVPRPMRSVKYSDQLRVIKTLEKLPLGGSFPIKNELTYTVKKMSKNYFPEYRIIIRDFGTSKRVFRAA